MRRFQPARLLAGDGRWRVLGLPDGRVQLDFGPASVVFTHAEFLKVSCLLAQAMLSRAEEGLLACAGPGRAVCYCARHNTLALIFDRAILRFRPLDLPGLAGLCREAAQALGPAPEATARATVSCFSLN